MLKESGIEWTGGTWNPVRGCTKVSPGCAHCYAETFAERFRGVKGNAYEQGFDLRLVPAKLSEPLRMSKPQIIFVNSMSDLFHEDVPVEYIKKVCDVMVESPWHRYQVLTKRAGRMRKILSSDSFGDVTNWSHIWWGVSVENVRHGLPRVHELSEIPTLNRFLSVEPLLEDVSEGLRLDGIDWVIVGGESGPGARPMEIDWVRKIRDKCVAERIPFFFKQWGGVNKKTTGNDLDGRQWLERPYGLKPDDLNAEEMPPPKERHKIMNSLGLA